MKKIEQLHMNPATASNRLLKDLLFDFAVRLEQDICFRCGKKLTRQSFSIDHIIPWLDSGNPKELFFNLGNVTLSHLTCNISAGRKPTKYSSREEAAIANRESKKRYRLKLSVEERKARRRATYLRTGK